MIPLVAILAWLPMPWDSITSVDDQDWYLPTQVEYVDHEPTEDDINEKIRLEELKQRFRILENSHDR